MRRAGGYILLLVVLPALLAGCGRKPRVLSDKKMVDLYVDMFVADQWLRDNDEERAVADTTLYFDPIFAEHKVTFEDFDASIRYYSTHLDKFSEIARKVESELKELHEFYTKALAERHPLKPGQKDFQRDTTIWEGPQTRWPVYVDPADTLPGPRQTDGRGILKSGEKLLSDTKAETTAPDDQEDV